MRSKLFIRRKLLLVCALAALAVALIAACGSEGDGPAAPGGGATATPANGVPTKPPLPTSTPAAYTGAKASQPAPVESVQLVGSEGKPVRWTLVVKYGLPGGCAEPGGTQVMESFPQQVTVNILLPADPNVVCTAIYSIASSEMDFGTGYEACQLYGIVVNGKSYKVQAVASNARCADLGRDTPVPGGPVPGIISAYDALFYSLQSQGVQVERGKSYDRGFFEFPPQIIVVNGQDVEVYEFRGVQEAQSAASRVSADGASYQQLGGPLVSVQWVAPPHFYLIANTVTVYIGADAAVLGALNGVAGKQFAGDLAGGTVKPVGTPVPLTAPMPTPESGRSASAAPIESVEIVIQKSLPPQYAVRVVSGQPNGCVRFLGVSAVRSGRLIEVSAMNSEPTVLALACTQVYGMTETVVQLGSDFEKGAEYTVRVNGTVEKTFTAQ